MLDKDKHYFEDCKTEMEINFDDNTFQIKGTLEGIESGNLTLHFEKITENLKHSKSFADVKFEQVKCIIKGKAKEGTSTVPMK